MEWTCFSSKSRALILPVLVLACLPLSAIAEKVVNQSTVIHPNDLIFALPEDPATIEVINPKEGSVLLVDGLLANQNLAGNGLAVIRFGELNHRFRVRLGQLSQVIGYGPVGGILIDNNGNPQDRIPPVFTIILEGEVQLQSNEVINIQVPSRGIIEFGDTARIAAEQVITAVSSPGTTPSDYHQINILSTGLLTASSGVAFDFSQADGSLLMQVLGGRIKGAIKGFRTAGLIDYVRIASGEIGSVSGIEQLTVLNTEQSFMGYPRITGNIAPASDGSNAVMTIQGPLVLETSKATAPMRLDADMTFSQNGALVIEIPETALSSPLPPGVTSVTPVVMTGSITLSGAEAPLSLIPTPNVYRNLLNSEEPLDYKVIEIINDDVATFEQSPRITHSVLVNLEELVNPGLDDTVEVSLTPAEPETVKRIIMESGGGESTQETIVTLIEEIEEVLSKPDATLPESLEPVFDTIVGIPADQPEQLLKLARESRVNNTLAHEVINLSRHEALVQIHQRIGSESSGISYGDPSLERGFWLQFMRSDTDHATARNESGDRILGFDLSMNSLTFGYDQAVDEVTLGSALTITNAHVDKRLSSDHSDTNKYQLTLYGAKEFNNWRLEGLVDGGYGRHRRERYLDGFFTTPLESEFDSFSLGLRVTASKTFQWQGLTIEPRSGIGYSRVATSSYKESDSGNTGFGQKVESSAYQRLELGAGLALRKKLGLFGGQLEPELRLMVWHDVKGDDFETRSALLSGSDELLVRGATVSQTRYEAMMNLRFQKSEQFFVTGGIGFSNDDRAKSQNYRLKLQYEF